MSEQFYHFGHPDFHVAKAEYFSPRGKVKLFLDITKKEKVLSIHFITEGLPEFNELFSSFAKWMENKYISDFPQFPQYHQEEFFPMLGLLFIEAISEWKGNKSYSSLSGHKEAGLICRCFGVYKEQIIKEVFADHEITAKGITNNLKAAGGCTKCLEDVREIISETKLKFGLIPEAYRLGETISSHYEKRNGKTPAEILLEIKNTVNSWRQKMNLGKDSFKIVQFNGEQMTIKMTPREDYQSLMSDLEECLLEKNGWAIRVTSLL